MEKSIAILGFVVGVVISGCATSVSFDPAHLHGSPEEHAALRSEYQAMKTAIEAIQQESLEACAKTNERCENTPIDEELADGPYVVFDCGYTSGIDPALEGSPLAESTLGLLIVAKGASFLEAAATGSKYPANIWRDSLKKYEKESLLKVQRMRALESRGETGTTEGLEYPYGIVLDMKMYRELKDPSLDLLQAEDGCGAGEFSVRFETEPKAKSLRIIPEFLAAVCLLQKKSLEDSTCRYWTDVPIGDPVGMSGIYRYEVTWSDGKKTSGAADFDVTMLGDDEEEAVFRITR